MDLMNHYQIRIILSFVLLAVIAFSAIFYDHLKDWHYSQIREPIPIQSQYVYFGRCPDCHLEKQPPSPCPQPMQAWAWEECMKTAHEDSNGVAR